MKNAKNISLGGYSWRFNAIDEALSERMAQTYELPGYLADLLCRRNVAFADVENFIYPKLQNLMPDPYVLQDMQKAVERVAEAVIAQEKIAIIGDYDVDGATSSSILTRFLKQVGIIPLVHIPSREEGYGPSDLAFAKFKDQKINLVITIDCGTTAFDVLNRAAAAGFEIIIIDHHEAEALLPKVYAVVNPKRLDEKNPYEYLQYMSAVGVGFMFLVALNRQLRQKGFYQGQSEPNLLQLLDLVALGTVCDVVPLRGLNRAYVKQGLKVMALQQNVGLKNLMQELKMSTAPSAYHLGFVLGPRINACGRVGDATLGSKLLCSENDDEAQKLAAKFNEFNEQRKEIENYVLLQAIEQVEKEESEFPMAFAYGKDWHQGVIGIVAGKLKERYHLPAFVMSVEDNDVKGSARSVDGVDLGALIIAAKEKGVITGGGGHTMAAGFSLLPTQINEFKKFAGEYISRHLDEHQAVPQLYIDCRLSVGAVNLNFAENISLLEPFGTGNPEPQIMLSDVVISRPQVVGSGHVKCFLSSSSGGYLPAIAFRCTDNEIGQALLANYGEVYDVVGNVKIDEWQGQKKVQFVINDIMRK